MTLYYSPSLLRNFKFYCILAFLTGSLPMGSMAQTISTIAGTTAGYGGDGGPATAASMNSNWGMAIDHTAGMIYVSDFGNCAVRKIDMATGIITTFAGTGSCGYSGDGGLATVAGLNGPTGVAVDNAGNVYISDIYNNRIRKVDITGIITTYAGNGIAAATGNGGPANLASIGYANGICMDNSNNLFIPDYLTETVRRVTAGTGIINAFAGSGIGGFFGDGGPALSARLNLTNDVSADNFNNIYISDWTNSRIRKVNTAGIISTFCGTGVMGFSGDGGPATAANTLGTMGFDFDCDNNMVVCDVDNHRIRYINTAGIITTIAGTGLASLSGDGGPAISATMDRPVKAAFDAIGNIYISDRNNNRIRKITVGKTVCAGSTVKFCNKTGTGTFTSSNTAVATVNAGGIVTGVSGGTATITLTLPAGYSAIGSVTVNPAPSAITGTLILCVGATISLSNAVAGGTWSIAPVTVATISPAGVVTGIAPGTATVFYTNTCGVATAIVTVSPPPGPISGSSPICSGSTITLSSSAGGGTWNIAPVSVATISPTGIVTGMSAGTATVSYTFGCGSVTTMITVSAAPDIISGNATICTGSTITLSNTAGGGTWSCSPGSIATISSGGMLTGIDEGVAVVTYTSGLCGSAIAYIAIAAPPKPEISANTPLCEGQTLKLKASHNSQGGAYLWTYPFGGSSSEPNPVIPNVVLASSGIYTVTYMVGGCNSYAVLNVMVYPYVVLTDVTPDQTIMYGDEVQLFALGAVYYNWRPSGTLFNSNINNPIARPLVTTVYTVYGMNEPGCPDTATVTITIDNDENEFIPSAFSPNGDGLNDIFRIQGMRNKKLVDFSIYNRWGERIYQNAYDPDKGWDGMYKGTPQDLGVYNYYIKVERSDGTLREYKGNVTLVR